MHNRILRLAWIAVLLGGCSHAITDGFRQDLPQPGTRTVVWGNDPAVVGVATTWLQKRGLSVIERGTLAQDIGAEADELLRTINVGHTLKDEGIILQAAKKLNVQEVVFVDRSGEDRAPMVNVRGLRVETGEVHWSGSARYSSFQTKPVKHVLTKLTCQALATAWEFRPPGEKWVSSQAMCEVKSPPEKAAASK